jgi:2-polyprenyl-6-methoxyphenol hydroxylase-like FAD-dependent oxidoreductase
MKPVTIIGGGLAGLTLGIGLRRREIPVTIHEAGKYPRHRVCGEFISGRGQETLQRLGLRELIDRAGALNATTAAFFSTTKSGAVRALPVNAICLSRFDMDHALAQEFRRLGGELTENNRWRGDFSEGVVRASGRRAQAEEKGARWFGLKVHARDVELDADLELHFSHGGYVGLCRLSGGEVNVSGLFRRNGTPDTTHDWRERLRGKPGSPLYQRMANAALDEESFCAVAGISLQPQLAKSREEFCLGDSITMIPPLTGNGMSVAFESAELAMNPLTDWSHVKISWDAAHQQVAQRCDASFTRRLAWAKWLQRLALTPALQNVLIALISRSELFWRTVFERTR